MQDVFPYPMEEFTNQNIGIDLLDNTCLVELEEKINEASDNYQIVRLIEEYLLNRLCENISCNANRMMATIHNINEGEGNISVLSQTACLGYKQFKRIFAEYVGLNPKILSKSHDLERHSIFCNQLHKSV